MTNSNQLQRLVAVRKNLLHAMAEVAGRATPEMREAHVILGNALKRIGEVRARLSRYPAYGGDIDSAYCQNCGALSDLRYNGEFYLCIGGCGN